MARLSRPCTNAELISPPRFGAAELHCPKSSSPKDAGLGACPPSPKTSLDIAAGSLRTPCPAAGT